MISEVIICTNTSSKYDIIEQINYYNILGFDKITVVDNNSPIDLNNLNYLYKNVTCIKNTLHLNQFDMYSFLYKKSTADWVFFSDDDEFLWIDLKKYNNINDFISKKYAELNVSNITIYWVKINNYKGIESRDFNNKEESQVKLFRYVNPLYEKDAWVKTIYKTKQNINFKYIHFCNPIVNIKTVKNEIFVPTKIRQYNYDYSNDDCLIYHYFFKTYNEFVKKIKYYYINTLTFNEYCAIIYNQNYISKTNNIYSILYDN